MEAARELPQLVERERELVGGRVERCAGRVRVGVELLPRQTQGERQRDQALLRAVVEVPLEAAPLHVAGGHDPRARGGELVEPWHGARR